ncbi:hypothetical protein [Kingella negevensis]|uniref:hypothetical protein n=1 Tax=Kingella negevensis TaxID=1522312 RepID=UPI00050A1450|nr:hypothetical protein [Kingella negevensis]MDK4679992.1 hypothetical protein [Kingella negevensis]MDK4682288.1 hypothetical protein [Kingella negevensis]MDK4688312.1 hypothetical protein [Kingella negevensis]MDK4690485.1 hypothetical protein [Kingella negevensis]MDK4692166.1 hypothetical protein [Kingella negevensis]
MSEIKVSCPECKQPVSLDSAMLNKTQGRADCPHCGFVFHLVKKSKKKPANATPAEISSPSPMPRNESANTPSKNYDALMNDKLTFQAFDEDSSVAKLNSKTDEEITLDLNGFQEIEEPTSPPVPDFKEVDETNVAKSLQNMFDNFADVDEQDNKQVPSFHEVKDNGEDNILKRQTKNPLSYRIPKAAEMFAEDETANNPFTFTMLDRDSIASQLPQVTMKEKNGTTAIAAQRSDQQNNITIHTDSLVFTLIGDGQIPANALPANNAYVSSDEPNTATQTQVQASTAVATQNDMNWTVATIAALMVLIVQLFYWVILMM